MRSALDRRMGRIRSLAPAGCAACRTLPPLVVLWPEEPEPVRPCVGCGRAVTGTTWVRFVQLDRGPA